MYILSHSSEKRGLRSAFLSRKMLQNFLYLHKKKNSSSFFRFSFWATFIFPFMNALVYVDIDQGIHKGKNESCSKWKTKKITWVFFLYKYRKFWSISLEFNLERKLFILDVWVGKSDIKWPQNKNLYVCKWADIGCLDSYLSVGVNWGGIGGFIGGILRTGKSKFIFLRSP